MSDKRVVDFQGAEIAVQWDGRLCLQLGECGRAVGELFMDGREPWCIPDAACTAEVREVVERCPSGALSYRDPSGVPELAPVDNTVTVSPRGPLFVTGDLAIAGAPPDMPGVACRAALCRCGASENKPFCDNSHLGMGFDDSGAVGERGAPLHALGGPLTIKPLPDGPLLVEGNLSIRAASGRLAWEGTEAALCRCGASANKPFCDGSHRAVGFKTT